MGEQIPLCSGITPLQIAFRTLNFFSILYKENQHFFCQNFAFFMLGAIIQKKRNLFHRSMMKTQGGV